MRTRRGKRSEAFWPSIVMKKWLNIKPEVYDFSEDEVDTASESEDDVCSLKDARVHMGEDHACGIQRNQSKCTNQTLGFENFVCPGTESKSNSLRHRRGKSETLRVQYIKTKDIRLTIGTWNVAGRLPDEHLEIDEWLIMQEPADIYILGFQEVVPLSAGNVLGAEDSRPIPKWEAIIRRTLNRSLEPESIYKSYSAPTSPVRATSVADALKEEVDNPATLDMRNNEIAALTNDCNFERCELNGMVSTGKKFQPKRLYGINRDMRLDWPEFSLDRVPQVLSANSKLRRVLSSSARVGFGWLERPITSSPQKFTINGAGMKRSFHSSGNLGLIFMEQPEKPELCDYLSDVLDRSSEEEDESLNSVPEHHYEIGENKDCVKSCQSYVRIVSKQMVGIYISVWVRKRLRRHINNLKVSPVGVGLMGYMGNKGSVSVSMSVYQTRICFVCSHLTSGHKDGDEQRRNSDVFEILQRTRFSSFIDSDQPWTIPSHDQIFWFGDLNYRLNMLNAEIRNLVARKNWDELINSDQLSKELRSGHVFDGWKEGVIDFPPTYKYEINSDRYVGENPKEGEKKRSPAWCDRILWLGKGIKQLCYKRSEIRISDHRPVSSNFMVEVEVFDHQKLQRALKAACAAVHPDIFLDEVGFKA